MSFTVEPRGEVGDDLGDVVAELLRDEDPEPFAAASLDHGGSAARDRAGRRQRGRVELGQAAQQLARLRSRTPRARRSGRTRGRPGP